MSGRGVRLFAADFDAVFRQLHVELLGLGDAARHVDPDIEVGVGLVPGERVVDRARARLVVGVLGGRDDGNGPALPGLRRCHGGAGGGGTAGCARGTCRRRPCFLKQFRSNPIQNVTIY